MASTALSIDASISHHLTELLDAIDKEEGEPKQESPTDVSTVGHAAICPGTPERVLSSSLEKRKFVVFAKNRLSPQPYISSFATLKFLIAKTKVNRLSKEMLVGFEVHLEPEKINIVRAIYIAQEPVARVDTSSYNVVPSTHPLTLLTENVTTNVAIAAIGFNAKGEIVARGVINYNGEKNLMQNFLIEIRDKYGAEWIRLDLASSISSSTILTGLYAQIKESGVRVSIRDQLLNPYKITLDEITNIELGKIQDTLKKSYPISLQESIRMIKLELTMGITQDGCVFVLKKCIWNRIDVNKLVFLHFFCHPKSSRLQCFVDICKRHLGVREELTQDLICVLKENEFWTLQAKIDFITNANFFLEQLHQPFY